MPIYGCFTPYEQDRISLAIAYIEKHYQDTISTDQLAIEVGIDIKKLQTGIQLRTGLTVHHYLLRIRVTRAAEDLQDYERPIKFIARKHGFCSASHFGSEFKKQMGMTPKEYRYKLLLSGIPFGLRGERKYKLLTGS